MRERIFSSTLVLAGSDSTSNALCETIEIMTHHPDVQDKLRAEIDEAQERYGSDIPYDDILLTDVLKGPPGSVHDPRVSALLCTVTSVSIHISTRAQKDIIMPVSQPITGQECR